MVCSTTGSGWGTASGFAGSTGHGAGNTSAVSLLNLLGEACTWSISALPKPGSPAEFDAFLRDQLPKWASMVKLAGAKSE